MPDLPAQAPPPLGPEWLPALLLGEVDSTQTRLSLDFSRFPSTDSRWRLCLARSQTQGVGRSGARWLAPVDSALLMTIGAQLIISPSILPRASLVAGLAVAQTLVRLGASVRIKWPNDLMVLHQNRWLKLGGILCQMLAGPRGDPIWLCGLGLNVSQVDPSLAGHAIALQDLGIQVPIPELAGTLAQAIRQQFLAWQQRGGALDVAATQAHLCFLGDSVSLDCGGPLPLRAVLVGIDHQGALIVRNSQQSLTTCTPLHIAASFGSPGWQPRGTDGISCATSDR